MLDHLPIGADPKGGDQGSDTSGGTKNPSTLGLDKDKDKPKKP